MPNTYFRARDILDKAIGTDAYFQIKSILHGIPAADVVEAVRCRECRYFRADAIPSCVFAYGLTDPKPDDFCSYGERRAAP